MSQGSLNLTGPIVWQDSDFWDKTSACGRFSIRGQKMNGKQEYVLWRHGYDGKVIPKHLGVFATFEEAAKEADEQKHHAPPKYNKIYDWKPLWNDK